PLRRRKAQTGRQITKPRSCGAFHLGSTRLLGLERFPAAAAAAGVRVGDGEAGSAEVFHVVDLRVFQIRHALWIDEDREAALLPGGVPVLRFVEREPILEAGAASALNEDAQRLVLR